ncbi:hypothetical protein SAMN03080599_03045 [Acidaminobacter hydrogenoformans DSM 2784]|uniref:Uncharacterized protein n=1 Tax=Acidaminobacter hydrogenoformans DSM 2784 TaxID=1120920 RepID=A0A1G5S7V7_9FIRM|nr:hypothetical protein SAMN03080599_03045 [Acidaminobacter hydrogenoformans DSM 2784]
MGVVSDRLTSLYPFVSSCTNINILLNLIKEFYIFFVNLSVERHLMCVSDLFYIGFQANAILNQAEIKLKYFIINYLKMSS